MKVFQVTSTPTFSQPENDFIYDSCLHSYLQFKWLLHIFLIYGSYFRHTHKYSCISRGNQGFVVLVLGSKFNVTLSYKLVTVLLMTWGSQK